MVDEERRSIQGFPDYSITASGKVWSTRGGKEPVQLKHHYDRDGYAQVNLHCDDRRITKRVHVLVLNAFVGPAPEGHECRHLNGDPSDARLVNLKWGTLAENIEDKHRHGRTSRGTKVRTAKLNDTLVVKIRERYAAGESSLALALEYGVSKPVILKAVTGISWKHVGGPITHRSHERYWQRKHAARLSEDQVREIRRRYKQGGISQTSLGKEHGVTNCAIYSIVRGRTWSETE